MNKPTVVCGIFLLAALLAGVGTVQANVGVGGWSLRANGQLLHNFQYSGSCPVDLQFGWGLRSPRPVTATYSFVRSDGGHSSASQTVNLSNSSQAVLVYYDWHLGAKTPDLLISAVGSN